MELTMDQFDRLDATLLGLRDECGEMRIEIALQRLQITQINDHLAKINGRIGRGEDRLTAIEYAAIEARGAWKAIAAAASAIGGIVAWIVSHFVNK